MRSDAGSTCRVGLAKFFSRYGHARGLRDETEKKVFEALNNKNWGASSTTLNDIARETYSYDKFQKIFKLVWEAADSSPRNWRKVFKALMLCEYLVKNGCERCVDEIRDHSFRIRHLQEFNYYEDKLDRGQGVRQKAKQLLDLLADSGIIRDARASAKRLRDKFVGHGSGSECSVHAGSSSHGGKYSDENSSARSYSDTNSTRAKFTDSKMTQGDAAGRYDSVTGANGQIQESAQLRVKAKSKMVPRIKLKDEGLAASEQTSSDPVAADVGCQQDLSASNCTSTFDVFSTTHDPCFDPRGQESILETRPSHQHLSQSTHVLPQPPPPVLPAFLPPRPLPHAPHALVEPLNVIPQKLAGEETPANEDFGEFATCPQPTPVTPAQCSESDFSALYSLDSLSLNVPSGTPSSNGNARAVPGSGSSRQAYLHHDAFTGLDAFSTAPGPMRVGGPEQPQVTSSPNLSAQPAINHTLAHTGRWNGQNHNGAGPQLY